MDNWKMPQLKAHQQWLLGRIDGYKWSYENLNLDEQNKEILLLKRNQTEKSERECSLLVAKILKAKADEKAELAAEKQRVHEQTRNSY